MTARYALAWVPMVIIAVANGAARDLVYGKRLSELRAHQVSTVTGIVLFGLYIFALTRYWKIESSGQALSIGFIWLLLTLAFEFLFGRFVAGRSWERLLHDYNLFAGRIWILIPVWIAVAPYLFYLIRKP